MDLTSEPRYDILLIEDNHADVELVEEWLREKEYPRLLKSLPNCKEAIEYLNQRHTVAEAALPRLILLDINLPGMNGLELLAQLKSDSHFKSIPVVMFTSSTATDDIERSYQSHANAYVQKRMDLEDLYESLSGIHDFWFTTAQLPE